MRRRSCSGWLAPVFKKARCDLVLLNAAPPPIDRAGPAGDRARTRTDGHTPRTRGCTRGAEPVPKTGTTKTPKLGEPNAAARPCRLRPRKLGHVSRAMPQLKLSYKMAGTKSRATNGPTTPTRRLGRSRPRNRTHFLKCANPIWWPKIRGTPFCTIFWHRVRGVSRERPRPPDVQPATPGRQAGSAHLLPVAATFSTESTIGQPTKKPQNT